MANLGFVSDAGQCTTHLPMAQRRRLCDPHHSECSPLPSDSPDPPRRLCTPLQRPSSPLRKSSAEACRVRAVLRKKSEKISHPAASCRRRAGRGSSRLTLDSANPHLQMAQTLRPPPLQKGGRRVFHSIAEVFRTATPNSDS